MYMEVMHNHFYDGDECKHIDRRIHIDLKVAAVQTVS